MEHAAEAAQALCAEIVSVFTVNQRRYNKVVLIAETTASMSISRREIAQLDSALADALADRFASGRLKTDAQGEMRLVQAGNVDECGKLEDVFSAGGSLVIMVTDLVSNFWREKAAHYMRIWGRNNFVNIVFVLPPRMLPGVSSAQSLQADLKQGGGFENNSQPHYELPWWAEYGTERATEFMKVPLIGLNPVGVSAWGRFMSGAEGMPGLIYLEDAKIAEGYIPREGVSEREEDRLRSFKVAASPSAYELAVYLARLGPLKIGLMESVQAKFFPNSDRSDLFDILLRGVLGVTAPNDDPEHVVFKFYKEVSDELLYSILISKAVEVARFADEYRINAGETLSESALEALRNELYP